MQWNEKFELIFNIISYKFYRVHYGRRNDVTYLFEKLRDSVDLFEICVVGGSRDI